MAEELNNYSEVKINNPRAFNMEADLDGSSENISLQQQRSKSNIGTVKLEPIRVELTDGHKATNNIQLQPIHQPTNPNKPQYQQPPPYQQQGNVNPSTRNNQPENLPRDSSGSSLPGGAKAMN